MISYLKNSHTLYIFLFILCNTAFFACKDPQFSSDPSLSLSFSADTVSFDTVFNHFGSPTAKILIYNKNNAPLNISSIVLNGGKQSSFRINVDGEKNINNIFENIAVPAKDSLYIFVDVTVDVTTSMMVEDSLTFVTNGNVQKINLQAFGKDVKVLRNITCTQDTTLTAEKPFIVFGNLVVDSAKTLTINAGCQFYFHNKANLIIKGNLNAQGTLNQPITMRGDRLDKMEKIATVYPTDYNHIAGQWGGIYLMGKTSNYQIKNVVMTSGTAGLLLDNEDKNSRPSLVIENCRIHNFLTYGVYVKNANLDLHNSEISNTGNNCVYLSGGNHKITHCTIANYFSSADETSTQAVRREYSPALAIMDIERIAPMETVIKNCIIAGSRDTEFELASLFPQTYKGTFANNYIKCSKALEYPQFKDVNIKWSGKNDTVFVNTFFENAKHKYYNFALDSVSPARGIADKNIDPKYILDINGKNRLEDSAPDAGAYEWKSNK